MLARLRSRLSYANVMATLAFFLALSTGGAYATHLVVNSSDIVDGEVKNQDLAANAVGSGKIADRGVKNADLSIGASSSNTIADSGIEGVDVKSETLTGTQVDESTLFNDDSLTNLDIGPDAVGSSEVAPDSLSDTHIADFKQSELVGVDSTVDGAAVTTQIDQLGLRGGTFRVTGSCNLTAATDLTAAVTITYNEPGWSVDSTAPGGQSSQVFSDGENATTTLISVAASAPFAGNKFETGTFAASAGSVDGFAGQVAVLTDISDGSCAYHYTRFGP